MRFQRIVFAVLLLTALVLSACTGGGGSAAATPAGGATTAPQTGGSANVSVDLGKQKFTSCAACHGPDAKGLPGLGKDLTTSAFVKSQSDEQLVAFIKQGRPASDPANTTGIDMPPKGGDPTLTDDHIRSIVAYIRTLQQ
jgi:disulfide bond formation protein DsbB